MAGGAVNRDALNRDDWDDVIKISPIKDIPQTALGKNIHFWDEWMENPDYNEFWEKSDWTLRKKAINVPALIMTGWFDDNITGSMEAWDVMNMPGKEYSRLLAGPWAHDINTARGVHGFADCANSLYYNIDLLQLQWFDKFLKDNENGVEKIRVTYYSLGSNTNITTNKTPIFTTPTSNNNLTTPKQTNNPTINTNL